MGPGLRRGDEGGRPALNHLNAAEQWRDRPRAGGALLQSGVIHVVFRNCCLTGETMSAKFGVWWSGPVAAAICVLCVLLGRVSPSAQEGQFFRIGAASTSGTFF